MKMDDEIELFEQLMERADGPYDAVHAIGIAQSRGWMGSGFPTSSKKGAQRYLVVRYLTSQWLVHRKGYNAWITRQGSN